MLLFIIILFFVSIGIVIYEISPTFFKQYQDNQAKKIEGFTKELPLNIVEKEKKHIEKTYFILPLIFGIAGIILFKNLIGVSGIVVGFAFAGILIKARQAQRRAKIEQQLVDALMLLSGSLKAGYSLIQAISVVAEEMTSPIKEEFEILLRENQMGMPLEESLYKLKRRVRSDELDLIVIAILVARETGGDLTKTFGQLVGTIRERDKLQRKVKVLCVQGRLQGWIMMLLPIAFAMFIYNINKHSFDFMLKDPLGKGLLIWAVISEILGIFFIRKLSNVEV